MNEQPYINTTTESDDEDEINLLELLRVIVRRKMLIIKVCSVAVLLSVCLSLTMKNTYSATATCYPPQRESPLGAFASILSQSNAIQALGGMGGTADVYLAIIKSRTVVDAVVKRLDLQKDGDRTISFEAARRAAMGAVKFETAKNGLLTVTAKSRDPQKAALLANTFVDEMIRRSVALYLTKAGVERHFLEARMDTVKVDLKNAESNLRDFQEKYKTIKADAQASVAIEGIARLKAEIVSKEVQLATLRNSMTDESSEVKALQAGIARLKSQLGTMTGSGGKESVIPAAGNLPGIGMEYLRRLREVKIQEAVFEQLSKQYELARINEAKDSSSVQIIDEAIPPARKSGPKRSLIVIGATFAAFIFSLGIIFFQEYLSKLSPEDAEIFREIKQSLRFRRRAS
ncbi:MAG: Wzz/FepE/Etk N-terminal domain-containing protein [Desulfobacteraceae bacterium]|nr:Wzz/FepE/Etk N-terminal domain-containing protein [Desulfobacteraceae bacterium]